MTESNVERVRRGYAALARDDYEPIRELLHPKVEWHDGDPASGCRNRDQALAFMRRSERPRPLGELVDVVDAGDQVVVIMRRRSDDEQFVANLTTFRDGLVVEMVHYEDPDEALAAAGLKP